MTSKFQQIAEQLQCDIAGGVYQDRLPSEQDLAATFHTTTITVRKALEILLQRGEIRKVPYVGTFVHREERKTIRIAWPDSAVFTPEQNRAIAEAVRAENPELEIQFDTVRRGDEMLECDLFRVVGTIDICYSRCAVPLPPETLERFRAGDYFLSPFDTHRVNNHFYGVPVLFSPSLLLWDRALLDGTELPQPYGLTWERFFELGAFARRTGRKLWDAHTADSLLRCLIYSCCPDRRLCNVDFAMLRPLLRRVPELFSADVMLGEPGAEKTICGWTCRQALHGKLPRHAFLTTLPALDAEAAPLNLVTGEFLLLSGASAHRAEALQVAASFLSPAVQRLIAADKTGLPVLKSAALDALDSREFRDDLFLNEVRNMLTNNASEQSFLLRLRSLTAALSQHRMTGEEFMRNLEYEFNMARCETAEVEPMQYAGM